MSDLHDMPGHLIRRFHQISVAIFMAELGAAGHDLTPVQYAALAMANAHPGVDQATLAGLIAYDRTTIGGVVDRLAQKGYIVRQISDLDRRARQVRLTEAGLKLLDEVGPMVARVQTTMLAGLDADERSRFMTLLRKATAAANDLSRAPLRHAARQTLDEV